MKTKGIELNQSASAGRARVGLGGATGIALGALSLLAACTASRDGGSASGTTAPAAAAQPEVTLHARPSFDVSSVVARVRATFRPAGSGYESRATNFALAVDGEHGVTVAPRHYLPSPANAPSASAIARGVPGLSPQATLRPGAAMAAHLRATRRDGAPVAFSTQSLRIGTTALSVAPTRTLVAPDGATEIVRGGLVERVHNQINSVEQSWRVEHRPGESGDLVLRVAVSGEEFAGQTAGGMHFVDRATGVGVRYGAPVWVDAQSHRTELAMRWDDAGAIEITVPASVVQSSAYPAVLDPTISPEFGIDTAAGTAGRTEELPAVAFDGTNYLVVWQDDRNKLGGNEATWDLYGARVGADGTVLDTSGIAIGTGTTNYFTPAVAYDGSSYLVVWVDDDQTAQTDVIFGATVSKSGSVGARTPIGADATIPNQFSLNPQIAPRTGGGYYVVWQESSAKWEVHGTAVSSAGAPGTIVHFSNPASNAIRPALDFDGTNFLVAWSDDAGPASPHIVGERVSSSNTLVDTTPVKITSQASSTTAPAQNVPAVVWNGTNYLVAWQNGSSGAEDIYARLITTSLTGATASDFVISNAAGGEENVRGARYGTNTVLAVWDDTTSGASNHNIFGRTVSTNAALGTVLTIANSSGDEQLPAVASDGAGNALVVFQNGVYTGARTNGVTVTAQLSLTTDKTTYATTDNVVITWDGFPGNSTDWIAVSEVGTADDQSDQSFYVNGQTNGTRTVTGLAAGTYELRGYYNWPSGGYNVQIRSRSFTVSGSPITLASDASMYTAGSPIVISWSGMPTNPTDWISIALVGSPANQDSAEFYTNGQSSGMHTLAGLPAGTYEIRAFYNWPSGGYNIHGTSASTFTVTASTQTITLTTDKSAYNHGDTVRVCWTNMPGASTDWIAVSPQGSTSDVSDAAFYTNGVQNGCQDVTGLPGGSYNYEVRAYFNWPSGGYNVQATSTTFTYAPAAPLTLSTNSTTYTVGQPVTVTWSGFPGNRTDWIAVSRTTAPNGSDTQEFYVNGLANGSQVITGLPAGTYQLRGYFNWSSGGYFIRGTSASFTVQ